VGEGEGREGGALLLRKWDGGEERREGKGRRGGQGREGEGESRTGREKGGEKGMGRGPQFEKNDPPPTRYQMAGYGPEPSHGPCN